MNIVYNCDHPRVALRLERLFYYRTSPNRPSRPIAGDPTHQRVELLISGSARLDWADRQLSLAAGTLLWHGPGQATVGREMSDPAYECIVLYLRCEPGEEAPIPRLTTYGSGAEARAFADRLLADCQHPGYDSDLLLAQVIAHFRWRAHISTLSLPAVLMPPALQRCLHQINRGFASDIGIDDLCRVAGLSHSRLHQLFREHLRSSPHQALLDRRLQEARLLLASSNQPVASIAKACGFGDPAHLSRRFKQAQGETPSAYRRRWAPPLEA